MNQWKDFKFNEPYDGSEISSINGIALPDQYMDFMKKHNGGEELYGINAEGCYFNSPSIGDEKDIRLLGNNIDELPNRINEMWSE